MIIFFYKKKNIFSFEKTGPKEFLYGLNFVQKYQPAKALFANDYQPKHLGFKLLEKFIARQSQVGIHFQTFLNNKNKIDKNDILFTVEDGVSFGLLFFKLLGKLDNKIVVLIQGLHDRYQYYKRFKWNKPLVYFFKKMLNKADCILTLSLYEKNLLLKSFRLPQKKVKVFYFAADTNFWNKNKAGFKKKTKKFVLTVGNDMHRDYNLLLKYYNLNMPLLIVSQRLSKNNLKQIKGQTLIQNYQQISNEKLRQLYGQAKFVIVPLRTSYATSGLSATLQAMAMEKPVLLAKTPAMVELFQDYKHVLYYKINSPVSFKKKLNELNSNKNLQNKLSKNAKKIVDQKFNCQNMGKRALKIIKSVQQ